MPPKVSLFASAVRIAFYSTFLDSLKDSSIPLEVVFAGNNRADQLLEFFRQQYGHGLLAHENERSEVTFLVAENIVLKYIITANIKPAQCYEIARRNCTGETILWCADDCVFTPDLCAKAYAFWAERHDNAKAVISIQTVENGQYVNMKVHSFFGGRVLTPLMAPLGLMSRQTMEDLGGFDRRYICGQYENDAVMRVIAAGGIVHIFGNRQDHIAIDHYARHGIVRPFAEGYNHDRAILEKSWTNGAGIVMKERQDVFQPYVDDGTLLQKSQAFKMNRWGRARTE